MKGKWYQDVEFDEYLEWPHPNKSLASRIVYYGDVEYAIQGGEDSLSAREGRQLHAWMFERDVFHGRYVEAPEFPAMNQIDTWKIVDEWLSQYNLELPRFELTESEKKKGREKGRSQITSKLSFVKWFEKKSGRDFVEPSDIGLFKDMEKALNKDASVKNMLSDSCFEVSIVSELAGYTVKGRLDAISNLGFVWDLKRYKDSHPAMFTGPPVEKIGIMNKWAAKVTEAAMYVDLAKGAGFDVDSFAFVCVLPTAPHSVYVHWVKEDSLEAGRRLYTEALDMWARYHVDGKARKTNHFEI